MAQCNRCGKKNLLSATYVPVQHNMDGYILSGPEYETLCRECYDKQMSSIVNVCSTCVETSRILNEWLGKQGHEACHYYPEIFARIASLHGLQELPHNLPSLEEFKNGCAKYQEEIYGKNL